MGFSFRALAPALAALALLAAVPGPAQAQTAEQEFSRMNADRSHRLGVQQYRVKNYDLALRHFERAVALAPDVQAYRRSLALTKQRIAMVKANQRALQENLNRSRKNMIGEEAAPGTSSPWDDDDASPAPNEAMGDAPGFVPGRDSLRPNPLGDPFNEDPVLPGVSVRDATRDLHLGGSGERLGLPTDLPAAGSGSMDLPVGRMPSELTRPMLRPDDAARPWGSPSETQAPTSGEGSMFPFLDPPKDPEPIRPRGPSTDGPNLDTPGTLP